MHMLDKIAENFQEIHQSLIDNFYRYEQKEKIIVDKWEKESLGRGISAVVDCGRFFDKAGINFSQISGNSLPRSSVGSEGYKDAPYFATGVSVVFHPKNPNIPTAHLNVRYFATFNENNKINEDWFGGGFDLTPYVPFKQDCKFWHQQAKTASKNKYQEWKNNCDDYFYLKHRNEHRGVGGIFYEKQTFEKPEQGLKLSKSVAESFLNGYSNILDKRKDLEFTERQKEFQIFRRGRYVEFNLLYDRGTLFGLQSGGRIESILMSLPSEVSWRYKFDQNLNSEEQNLYNLISKKHQWI